MTTTTATIELTALEKDDLCGGHWEDRYPIPDESQFDAVGLGRLAAPELAAIAGRLIARDDLGIGHLSRFRLMFLWAKSGGTSGGKPRWGSVALANPDLKHVTEQWEGQPADAVVRLAADNLRDAHATRWQVANELCFLLSRIGLYTTQEGGDERLTLIAPDAAFFTPQMRLFGPQTPELKRTILDIRQARFDWAATLADDIARADAADIADLVDSSLRGRAFDPSPPQAPGVDEEIGPVEGGAPAADWAEPHFARDADDPVTDDVNERRVALVRSHFGTYFDANNGDAETCTKCGILAIDHDPEVCQGGTPATRKRRAKKTSANGAHDPAVGDALRNGAADADGPLLDPDRVMATLSQAGWSIAYQLPIGEAAGHYVNIETGAAYDLGDVETSYRRAISGR